MWNRYLERVERMLHRVPSDERDDILLELSSHLHESAKSHSMADETERLSLAIEKLGEPEEFLKPIIAMLLATSASRSYAPLAVMIALAASSRVNTLKFLGSVLLGLGYSVSVLLGVLAVLKLFIPERVGLFRGGDNYVLGILRDTSGMFDTLGYTFIPISLAVSLLMYFALTWLLVWMNSQFKISKGLL